MYSYDILAKVLFNMDCNLLKFLLLTILFPANDTVMSSLIFFTATIFSQTFPDENVDRLKEVSRRSMVNEGCPI